MRPATVKFHSTVTNDVRQLEVEDFFIYEPRPGSDSHGALVLAAKDCFGEFRIPMTHVVEIKEERDEQAVRALG